MAPPRSGLLTALLAAAFCSAPMTALAQAASGEAASAPITADEAEEYKSITLVCAAVYEDQLNRNLSSDVAGTSTKRETMLELYTVFAGVSEESAKQDVSKVASALPRIEAQQLDQMTSICNKLTED